MSVETLTNFVDGKWKNSIATEAIDVTNPGTGEVIAKLPLSPAQEVDEVTRAAVKAFRAWRNVPVMERITYLFKFESLIKENFDELARTITMECGKTLAESGGEMQRALENVQVACAIPTLMQGQFSENIASGIDEFMIRQPVGVGAALVPFNFPAMIPFWFFPYAIACGNAYIVKPSEKVPLTMRKAFQLLEQTGLPKGVVNLINGTRETSEAILDHPDIRAISFVGSTPIARQVYARAAANGKRVQCQGGAKNPILVLPDADMDFASRAIAESSLGCAGQRCLAGSMAITVGEARKTFTEAIAEKASSRRVGYGLDDGVEMGPVITPDSKSRIEGLIQKGADEGAKVLVDGRKADVKGYAKGNYLKPTLLEYDNPNGEILKTEIFGPVLSLLHVNTIDDAIKLVNSGKYGNMACLFTESGSAARKFRNEAEPGNIGINIGVAAPIAAFPFSGAKESFFGDLHAQGRHAIEFFTQTKVVVERWPNKS